MRKGVKIVPVLGLIAGCASIYLHVRNDNNSRKNFIKIESQIKEITCDKEKSRKKSNNCKNKQA